MRTRLWVTGVALLLSSLLVWQFVLRPATQAQAPKQTVTVKLGAVVATVSAPGQLEPERQTSVYAMNGGLVKELTLKPGASVAAGQVILRFDISGVEAQMLAQWTQVNAAQTALTALETGNRSAEYQLAQDAVRQATQMVIEARSGLSRAKADYALGAMAAQTVDASRATLARAEDALSATKLRLAQFRQSNTNARASARAQLEALLTQLRQLEQQRSAAAIRAPLAGTLTDLSVTLGQAVMAGSVVAHVSDLSSWIVQSRVAETDLPGLRVGMSVKVQVNALTDVELEGKVVRVGQAQKYRDPLYYYQVDARLIEPGVEHSAALTPSLTTSTSFITQQLSGVPVIPLNALQTVGDKTVVEVLTAGKSALVEVKTGLDDGTNIAVLKGLKPGDVVVIPPPPGASGDAPSVPGGLGGIVKF